MPLPSPNSRNRIELSRQEMCVISQKISRDFSPRFFAGRAIRKAKIHFSAQELLDISQQISREHAPSKDNGQSKLVLLAVSPKRLHAYWHIAKRRLTQALKHIEQQQPMTLRIYAQVEPDTTETPSIEIPTHWFDVPIVCANGQQDIYLPESSETSAPIHYHAAVGETIGDRVFVPLTYSNTTIAPRSVPIPERNELPNAITQFIMTSLTPSSSAGKTASGQGK